MKVPPASPTGRLLAGLAVTLAAVAVFGWNVFRQIDGLRRLQTSTVDRNRKDTLQLLRIQNDLNSLGLAIRDMLDSNEPYPPDAWKGQFERIRRDLEDAVATQAQLAPASPGSERRGYLVRSLNQFWTSADQAFALSRRGDGATARDMVRNSLQAQQASLTTTVARLLVQNNETEEQAMAQIQEIYRSVERNLYFFLAVMVGTILLTSLYVIYSNRRVIASMQALSQHRSDLARQLITVQEEMLHSIARDLHDEFGQILTAIGTMLQRAEKRAADPAFREEVREVREVAQTALDKVRSLSQALHPSVLDDAGLEGAIDWYLPVYQKQTGIAVKYDKSGKSPVIANRVAIHVYRVLQEALNNVARHSGSAEARVGLTFSPGRLRLEVEDRGVGLPERPDPMAGEGIGIVGMRERAELLNAELRFSRPAHGGTLVRLSVPIGETDG